MKEPNEMMDTPQSQAIAQREAGDIHGAIGTLIAAAHESLADVGLAVTLGQMLKETGQTTRAERWLRHAIKLAPDDLYARMGYGAFLAQTGRTAEAIQLLSEVREEVRDMQASEDPDERESVYCLESFMACTEVNLAGVACEAGDTSLARELATPWLNDEDYWPGAHNVLAKIVEKDGLDPSLLAEQGLASGHVSPFMVCHLLETAVDAEHCDYAALERLFAMADACFAFEWKHLEPELDAVVDRARQRFVDAVMRGVIEPDECPHLATLVTQPGRATGPSGERC